jgi:hypothetical protein
MIKPGRGDDFDKVVDELRDRITAPQTNLDRIRAMSAEELAEWVEKSMDCCYCPARKTCSTRGDKCRADLHQVRKARSTGCGLT